MEELQVLYCDPVKKLEARFEKMQAEQDMRQAEQNLHNKKVINQVLFYRHLC